MPVVTSPITAGRSELAPQAPRSRWSQDRASPSRVPAPRPRPPAAPAEPAGPGLAEADAAFRAKKYAEAGRIYGSSARRLTSCPPTAASTGLIAGRRRWPGGSTPSQRPRPSGRTSTPRSPRSAPWPRPTGWASTSATALQLAPRPGRLPKPGPRSSARPPPTKPRRVREPPGAARHPHRLRRRVTDPGARRSRPVPATSSAPRTGQPVGRWRVRESANFRVFHADPNLAEQVVQVAEVGPPRPDQAVVGQPARRSLAAPVRDLPVPDRQQYAQMTGQPADSPGFSTMGMNEGQIISRRVNLRTDHDGLLAAVLPHEVTHVILADFFTEQQIPRWADEGMAVLTEPAVEQKRRAVDLVEPLGQNLLFPIEDLMKMDYPDNRYWSLYYAQSVSLTRFLVEQGTPAQLVQFLQGAQTKGFEAELSGSTRSTASPTSRPAGSSTPEPTSKHPPPPPRTRPEPKAGPADRSVRDVGPTRLPRPRARLRPDLDRQLNRRLVAAVEVTRLDRRVPAQPPDPADRVIPSSGPRAATGVFRRA